LRGFTARKVCEKFHVTGHSIRNAGRADGGGSSIPLRLFCPQLPVCFQGAGDGGMVATCAAILNPSQIR